MPPCNRNVPDRRCIPTAMLVCGSLMAGACAKGVSPYEQDSGQDETAQDVPMPPEDSGSFDTGGLDTGLRPDTGTPPDTGRLDTGVRVDTGVRDVPVASDLPLCRATIVVNEIQVAGSGGAADEFVELANLGTCAQSLNGWSIRYASAAGTTDAARWTGLSTDLIPAGGYVVIAGTSFIGTVLGRFAGTTGALAATGGGVGIYTADMTRVDSVGYGAGSTNLLVEGAPVVAPASGQSIARFPNGTDTNHNNTDLQVRTTPTPGAVNR